MKANYERSSELIKPVFEFNDSEPENILSVRFDYAYIELTSMLSYDNKSFCNFILFLIIKCR